MLTTLLSSIMELALCAFTVIVLYQIFLSDWVDNKRMQWKEDRNRNDSVDKIAQVKLVSDDPKGIEKFVTNNAQYLSDQMVKKLVSRIESIKADGVISADDILKSRIAELQPEEEEDNVETRSQRSGH